MPALRTANLNVLNAQQPLEMNEPCFATAFIRSRMSWAQLYKRPQTCPPHMSLQPSPKRTSFPATTIARKGGFSGHWYEQLPWLQHIGYRDAVFRKACSHYREAATQSWFIKTVFKDRKHLSKLCFKHETSKAHAEALGRRPGQSTSSTRMPSTGRKE